MKTSTTYIIYNLFSCIFRNRFVVLYPYIYLLALWRISSWGKSRHAKVQLCVFLGLSFLHFALWLLWYLG